MAQIHPAGWREVAATGAALREIETLTILAEALPDAYSVYHGVHWTRIEKGVSAYGETDFIVLAPSGRIVLIEQKSGFLTETENGLVKQYQGQPKNVCQQIARSVNNLLARFDKGGERLSLDYLLYCPDYHVKNPALAGIEPARIVDAGRRDQLAHIIQQVLPLTEELAQRAKVARFLGDVLELVPDASTMIGSAAQLVTRLSGGLATWARQLEFSPFRLRVTGTAGSGKTQLALAEFRAALDAGKTPLYVCYNRPLADHVQRLMPTGGRVANFHLLADSFLREHGAIPDYRDPSVWERMEQALLCADIPESWRFDVVIVDEGQDFSETWRDAVLRLLKPDGRALWLEDPMQNLYGRAPVALDGWIGLRSNTNFRSPRDIVQWLSRLGGAGQMPAPVEAGSPFLGADIDILSHRDGDVSDLYDKTKQAITTCLGTGFARSDLAVISFRGRDKSALLRLDQLGPHRLKSFTGDYDWFGNPVMRSGDLLVESVYRFKGQSAPAVILTEIDFAELDERVLRKLFVGMTRAKLKLVLVLSERAAATLIERMA